MSVDPAANALPPLRFELLNYRGIRKAAWAPSGVCALVGRNGSGKSTLFSAATFLKTLFSRPLKDAILLSGGYEALRHLDAEPTNPHYPSSAAPVRLAVTVGETTWTVELDFEGDRPVDPPDETIVFRGGTLLSPGARFPGATTFIRAVGAAQGDPATLDGLDLLLSRVGAIETRAPWSIEAFRANPSSDPASEDLTLAHSGRNIAVLLQNWRDRRDSRDSFHRVEERLRTIHPESFSSFEFGKQSGGLQLRYFPPGAARSLPLRAASDGMLSTLFMLSVIESLDPRFTLFFDEPENGLHPAAIRTLIDAMRERCAETGATVVLATHSPVLLDAFSEEPEQVFVTEQGPDGSFPTRLTDLRSADWLANFRLGSVYGSGFARQDPRPIEADDGG